MKKIILSLLFLPMVLLFSCTDLDDVNERLDEHEERLNALETLVGNANTTINNLQKLVDAQGQKVSVVSYEALPNGAGYVLRMSDGSEITLKNGSDGQAPSVGVKEQDGTLYWTVNGEIMRDADGNPIKAEGQDGESGQTPKIRVNTDGEWEVSLDGGKTWQAILDENGNPVNAVGSDAEVDLTITETEDSIIIVYDGQTFIIPKGVPEEKEPIDVAILGAEGVYTSDDSNGLFTITLNAETTYFYLNFISDKVADSDLLNADLIPGTYIVTNTGDKFTIATDSYLMKDQEELPVMLQDLIVSGELIVEYQDDTYTIAGTIRDDKNNAYTITYSGLIDIEPEYDVVFEKQNGWYWGDDDWDHPDIAEYMSNFVQGKTNTWGELDGDGYYVALSFYHNMAPKAWEAQIPNQTYTASTNVEVGTFNVATQEYIDSGDLIYRFAYLRHIDSEAGINDEIFITGGTIEVMEHEDGQEVRFNLELEDGTRHVAKYVGYVRQGDEYTVTTLVNDLEVETFNHGSIEYKGKTPMYGLENNRWNIYLGSENVTIFPSKYYWWAEGTGDYLRIGIFTALEDTEDIPEGTYTFGEELPGNASIGQGYEPGLDFGTWYFELINDNMPNYAPIKTGNVVVSKTGDIYTITLTGKDDRQNTITATYTGALDFVDTTIMSTTSPIIKENTSKDNKKMSLYEWKKASRAQKLMKRNY